jgi:hypothetical protein
MEGGAIIGDWPLRFFSQFFGPRDARVATTAGVDLLSLENLLSCGVCCSSLLKKHRKKLEVFVFLQFSFIGGRLF